MRSTATGEAGESTGPGDGDGDAARTLELFVRWRGGDDLAAAQLFELHKNFIAAHVVSSLGPKLRTKIEADDVVQDVGICLLRYQPKAEDGAVERFRGLLRTMVSHVITDHHRRLFGAEKRYPGVEHPIISDTGMAHDPPREQASTPSAAFARQQDVALARVTFWFVEPERRDLIALRWWYDTPFSELAERFGADDAAMRMRHLRATQEFGRVLTKVKAALAQLPTAEADLLAEESSGPPGATASVDSRVLAHSRVTRFASFLAVLRKVATLIGEPLHPLADGWPRILRTVPSRGAKDPEAPPPAPGRDRGR